MGGRSGFIKLVLTPFEQLGLRKKLVCSAMPFTLFSFHFAGYPVIIIILILRTVPEAIPWHSPELICVDWMTRVLFTSIIAHILQYNMILQLCICAVSN